MQLNEDILSSKTESARELQMDTTMAAIGKKLRKVRRSQNWEVAICEVCGATDSILASQLRASTGPLFVSICSHCGLVYLNPRWTSFVYERYYQSQYDETYRPQTITPLDNFDPHAAEIRTRVLAQTSAVPIGRILDIGAGEGGVLQHLHDYAWPDAVCEAIEPSRICRHTLASKPFIKVVSDRVDTDWHRDCKGRYDLVIMRHVLEHFMHPLRVLQKVCSVLSERGILYLAVPDMMSPTGSPSHYWFRVAHTYYFSDLTLSSLARQAGLDPLCLRTENSEVWGILRRGAASGWTFADSAFSKQNPILRQYISDWRGRDFRILLNKRIRKCIPKPLKCILHDLRGRLQHNRSPENA